MTHRHVCFRPPPIAWIPLIALAACGRIAEEPGEHAKAVDGGVEAVPSSTPPSPPPPIRSATCPGTAKPIRLIATELAAVAYGSCGDVAWVNKNGELVLMRALDQPVVLATGIKVLPNGKRFSSTLHLTFSSSGRTLWWHEPGGALHSVSGAIGVRETASVQKSIATYDECSAMYSAKDQDFIECNQDGMVAVLDGSSRVHRNDPVPSGVLRVNQRGDRFAVFAQKGSNGKSVFHTYDLAMGTARSVTLPEDVSDFLPNWPGDDQTPRSALLEIVGDQALVFSDSEEHQRLGKKSVFGLNLRTGVFGPGIRLPRFRLGPESSSKEGPVRPDVPVLQIIDPYRNDSYGLVFLSKNGPVHIDTEAYIMDSCGHGVTLLSGQFVDFGSGNASAGGGYTCSEASGWVARTNWRGDESGSFSFLRVDGYYQEVPRGPSEWIRWFGPTAHITQSDAGLWFAWRSGDAATDAPKFVGPFGAAGSFGYAQAMHEIRGGVLLFTRNSDERAKQSLQMYDPVREGLFTEHEWESSLYRRLHIDPSREAYFVTDTPDGFGAMELWAGKK